MKINGVPFYRQSFGRAEIVEIADTIKSHWITTGPKARLLENRIAEYLSAKHAIAVNSCTAAMHLMLQASGIGPRDEVITTPYTFAATSEAILYTGATPIYCDIDYDTLNMTADEAGKKITRRTKALLPVHIAGLPLRMDRFVTLAKGAKLNLFDDAAHALGAEFKGKKIGTIGDASAFSFYATKNLTTAEGGMITTRRVGLAGKVRLLSLHGMSKEAWRRYAKGGSWRYDLLDLGYKYNLSDLHASLGLAQFTRFEKLQALRRRAARRYIDNLSTIDSLKLPVVEPDTIHAWHLFLLRLRLGHLRISRDRFIEELAERNIGTSVHFIPLFRQSYYRRRFQLHPRQFPNAEKAYREVITLPLFPDLKPAEIDYVCEALASLCRQYRR